MGGLVSWCAECERRLVRTELISKSRQVEVAIATLTDVEVIAVLRARVMLLGDAPAELHCNKLMLTAAIAEGAVPAIRFGKRFVLVARQGAREWNERRRRRKPQVASTETTEGAPRERRVQRPHVRYSLDPIPTSREHAKTCVELAAASTRTWKQWTVLMATTGLRRGDIRRDLVQRGSNRKVYAYWREVSS